MLSSWGPGGTRIKYLQEINFKDRARPVSIAAE
jgi:hypothetical protein